MKETKGGSWEGKTVVCRGVGRGRKDVKEEGMEEGMDRREGWRNGGK